MRKYLPSARAVKPLRARRVSGPGLKPSSADYPVLLSLVVPVHNGAERLPATLEELTTLLHVPPVSLELVLVDDGSDRETAAVLDDFVRRESCVRLLRNAPSRGKGHAVARGLREARGRYRVFTDADLAYPIEEVLELLPVLEGGADVVVACRVLPESRYLMSPAFFHYLFTRHLMSRVFNLLVRLFLIPQILDSQAGLKGMSAEAAEDVVPRLTIHGFAFDVELLYVAHRRGLKIAQAPVFFRYDSEPSTVSIAADALRMTRDLARIRWNDLRGRYG